MEQKFTFSCGLRVAKELLKQGFECRVVVDNNDKLVFLFERSDEIRQAYKKAKEEIYKNE